MDDYRDLVAAALVLLCAGIMLVAAQLYIEHRAPDLGRNAIETPAQPGPAPMVLHTPVQKVSEPVQDRTGKQPT